MDDATAPVLKNYLVYFPTTADLFALYERDDAWFNHVNNIATNTPAGGYWTTLASYLPGGENDAYDYELLNATVTGSLSYQGVDLTGFAGQPLTPVVSYNKYVDTTIGGIAVDKDTEIYIVYGDTLANSLLNIECLKGASSLPTIYAKDIHGIYGIVQFATFKTLVIEVDNTNT